MSAWTKLAALLGVRTDQVEDALADTRRARVQLDRRGFLMAGAALAAGALGPKAIWSVPVATSEWIPTGHFGVPGVYAEIIFGQGVVVPNGAVGIVRRVYFFDSEGREYLKETVENVERSFDHMLLGESQL